MDFPVPGSGFQYLQYPQKIRLVPGNHLFWIPGLSIWVAGWNGDMMATP
jgi:hypothetical protein